MSSLKSLSDIEDDVSTTKQMSAASAQSTTQEISEQTDAITDKKVNENTYNNTFFCKNSFSCIWVIFCFVQIKRLSKSQTWFSIGAMALHMDNGSLH